MTLGLYMGDATTRLVTATLTITDVGRVRVKANPATWSCARQLPTSAVDLTIIANYDI